MSSNALTDEQRASRARWGSVHLAGDRGPKLRQAPVFYPFWKPEHEIRAIEEKRRG